MPDPGRGRSPLSCEKWVLKAHLPRPELKLDESGNAIERGIYRRKVYLKSWRGYKSLEEMVDGSALI